MARPWTPIDTTLAESYVQSGYGQGIKHDYKPWINKEKVWAKKPVTALKGVTTGRVHYLVGELAHPYFSIVEWSSMVIDIREQYPLLPLEETIAIAKRLGIRHLVHAQTRKPVVLVTDFLLTVRKEGETVQQARALTTAASLDNQRNLELLEIERRYWAVRGVDWGIATEHEIPIVIANNINYLHGHMLHALSSYLSEECCRRSQEHVELLTRLVQEQTDQPLNHLTQLCDTQLGCPPGTALAVAYHLLATRQWQIDMQVPINPRLPLVLLGTALNLAEEWERKDKE